MGVPGILLAVAADRLLTAVRAPTTPRALIGLRTVALVWVLGAGAFTAWASPLDNIRLTFDRLRAIPSETWPEPNPEVEGVRRWILEHTTPDQRVFFLPNNAAYHYLTNRRSPTRWVVSHQMVTDAHRREAVAALRARPPAYVVYDPTMSGLDGIPDSTVFGQEMLDWLELEWIETARFGDAAILRPLAAGEQPCPRPPAGPPRPLHVPGARCR
jgi:hypothetical protein